MESLKNLPPTFVGTFIRQIKMLQIIHISIFDERDATFVRKHIRFIIFTSMVLFMFVGQILHIVKRKEVGANILDILKAVPSILIVIQNMVKMFAMSLKRNQIKELILDIGKMWRLDHGNDKKNKEMDLWIRGLKFWNNVLWVAVTLSILIFTAAPLILTVYKCYTEPEPEYKLILEMIFFSHLDSYFKYSMAMLYQVLTCNLCQKCIYGPVDYVLVDLSCGLAALLRLVQIDLLSLEGTANLDDSGVSENVNDCEDIKSNLCQMCVYGPVDYLLVDLSCGLAALLRLVQIDLLSLEGTANLDDSSFSENVNDCEDIKSIVKTHQILLSLTDRLNNIYKEIIFSQVYLSSMIICCYLFTAMMPKSGLVPILGDLIAAMFVLLECLILAVPGQNIADMSSGVADAAYQSIWYERSFKFRKYIAIVIARSQKPCYLSALGFSDLTFVMFSKVATTSWSYLSLLNHMSENFDV